MKSDFDLAAYKKQIFEINTAQDFNNLALQAFHYQYQQVPIYRQFVTLLNVAVESVKTVEEIPFLPISFFKTQQVKDQYPAQLVFSSSGTTGMQVSNHFVHDLSLYQQAFTTGFEYRYGALEDYLILALLPSYLERTGSSLIHMLDRMIQVSKYRESDFYLHNFEKLYHVLQSLANRKIKIILLGVTFALLDFVEQFQLNMPDLIVMDTGGMKGRRKELLREEVHAKLKAGFGVHTIHSEYGMTELLSQAYSKTDGHFECPPWMQVMARDTGDPLQLIENGKTGGLNIIDLANIHSCCFIASEDLSKVSANGFQVLGRFDYSEVRGCNLMYL